MRDLRAVIHWNYNSSFVWHGSFLLQYHQQSCPEKLIRQQWRQPMEILSVASMRTILPVLR